MIKTSSLSSLSLSVSVLVCTVKIVPYIPTTSIVAIVNCSVLLYILIAVLFYEFECTVNSTLHTYYDSGGKKD